MHSHAGRENARKFREKRVAIRSAGVIIASSCGKNGSLYGLARPVSRWAQSYGFVWCRPAATTLLWLFFNSFQFRIGNELLPFFPLCSIVGKFCGNLVWFEAFFFSIALRVQYMYVRILVKMNIFIFFWTTIHLFVYNLGFFTCSVLWYTHR